MVKLALLLLSVVASLLTTACMGGIGLGAASAAPLVTVTELMVTCLACGEQWVYLPSAGLSAGCLALLRRRRKPHDECPKCHSRTVAFGHSQHAPASDRRNS